MTSNACRRCGEEMSARETRQSLEEIAHLFVRIMKTSDQQARHHAIFSGPLCAVHLIELEQELTHSMAQLRPLDYASQS
jgi:hypothetical protein